MFYFPDNTISQHPLYNNTLTHKEANSKIFSKAPTRMKSWKESNSQQWVHGSINQFVHTNEFYAAIASVGTNWERYAIDFRMLQKSR